MRLTNPIVQWRQRRLLRELSTRIASVEAYLAGQEARAGAQDGPVLFFNASTRIHRLSLNGAFSLLAAWAVRAAGHEVRHLVCEAGMQPCVLGTDRRSPQSLPPCSICLDLSRTIFPAEKTQGLPLDRNLAERLRRELRGLSLGELTNWEYGDLPLGEIVRPSVRWILRRHRLADTPVLRELYAHYLASAGSQAEVLRRRLTDHKPRALVVFNGIFFPEAIARRLAQSMGIPVVTHEVGLRPFSAFFSHRQATFRELALPADFELSGAQEAELDAMLSRRFRGDFSMAGIRFWPEMRGLPEPLLDSRRRYRQVVSVFTNVIFDTSQAHANVLFEDMWSWLDDLIEVMRREVDTLFVIRAHPDETRQGKESEESVAAWFRASGLETARNVAFISPDDPVSSYELVQASKFILVYNSSVGLEASILGRPALCAGRARFTQMETTYFPADRSEYRRRLEELLGAERPQVPELQRRNARAFLYYELFHASLDLSEFLLPDPSLQGMVLFSDFAPERLAKAGALQVIRDGILHGRSFVMPAEAAERAAALPS